MKFIFFSLLPFVLSATEYLDLDAIVQNKTVIATRRYFFEDFPEGHNPSLFKVDDGYLLCFRHLPDKYECPYWSYIVLVKLNENLDPISKPEILNTREKNSKTPSQSEDARIFAYRGRLFIIYNDNVEIYKPTISQRRDMFVAELINKNGKFRLSSPLKFTYPEKYYTQWWQKNWAPFEWQERLLISYTLEPHEVVLPNLKNGECYSLYETSGSIFWEYGTLRDSSPPLLVDGEYLGFFHSGTYLATSATQGHERWHYFMGAYTFSPHPPFALTRISPMPIVGEDFYTPSFIPDFWEKRVIFPGGFAVSGDLIYVAYGKDDREIWIATIDKKELILSLVPVEHR
jgi:predicted GH43/DUF377 family glycosyl hydrolase